MDLTEDYNKKRSSTSPSSSSITTSSSSSPSLSSPAPATESASTSKSQSIVRNETDQQSSHEAEGLFKTRQEKRRYILRQVLDFTLMIVIDVGLPLAIYYVMKMYVTQLVALILSGIPPLINVIVKFIRKRKLDALGLIFVFAYVLSGVLSVISGDARLALLRDSTVTCVVSCLFLITLVPIRTKWITVQPLCYLIAQSFMTKLPPMHWTDQDGVSHEQILAEFLWEHVKPFRIHSFVMTALWGIFLMGEFIAKLAMIKSTMSIDTIVWVSTVIGVVITVFLVTLSTLGSILLRKRIRLIIQQWKRLNDFSHQYNDPAKSTTSTESVAHLL